ncbi:hypothetical protein ACFPRL_01020 [Pseudoclavibacter helvolus]
MESAMLRRSRASLRGPARCPRERRALGSSQCACPLQGTAFRDPQPRRGRAPASERRDRGQSISEQFGSRSAPSW